MTTAATIRIDCHVHIFPENVKENRKSFFDDASFALLYKNDKARIETAENLIRAMDAAGITLACAMGFPWENPDRLAAHNNTLLEAARKFPERILPFCCIRPESEGAVREAERCLSAGAAGLGEIACYESDFTDKILNHLSPVMELCLEHDAPVFFHTNDPVGHTYPGKAPVSGQGIEKLVQRFSENRMVLAHGGGGYPFFHLIRKGLSGNPERLFYDTAAFPYLYRKAIYPELLRILGPKQLLFGSDWPLLPMERYFQDMMESGLSGKEIKDLCGLNALHFLKPKPCSGTKKPKV